MIREVFIVLLADCLKTAGIWMFKQILKIW